MYKDDLQAAHCRIEQLEGELEQYRCNKECSCKKGFFRKVLGKTIGRQCWCGEPLYKCVTLYFVSFMLVAAGVAVYFMAS